MKFLKKNNKKNSNKEKMVNVSEAANVASVPANASHQKKRCSIVITAYNVETYIEQAVISALAQSEQCQVIVVEDKSTDHTMEVLERFGDRIILVKNDVNVGAGLSRRRGIERADSEFVMLLDGDDYIEPNFVETLLLMADQTGADIVSGGIRILREDGSWDATSYGNCVTDGRDKVSKFWGERIVFMNNKIIRKELCDRVPYNERRYIEDTPTIIPMLHYANRVAYVDTVGYTYRMRSSSLTHTTNALKDIVFKGLCWLDLLEFFNREDKGIFEVLNIKGFLRNIVSVLNQLNVTEEMVQPYRKEWDEFTMRLLNAVVITGVNLVEGVKGQQQTSTDASAQ